jgi:hypothetical protein
MHTLHYNLHICFSSLGPRRERFLFLICRVALMSELRFLPALLCFHNYEYILGSPLLCLLFQRSRSRA